MPAIILHTSVHCSEKLQIELAKELSRICAKGIGKPEDYVMSVVDAGNAITFAGEAKPAAFVEVRSIGGLSHEVNTVITKNICNLLASKIKIDAAHTYVNFMNFERDSWGWQGQTFG